MRLFKQLCNRSTEDLQKLQEQILMEIQRRKEAAAMESASAADDLGQDAIAEPDVVRPQWGAEAPSYRAPQRRAA